MDTGIEMDKPSIFIIDAQTGETSIEPLSKKQIAEREAMLAETETAESARLASVQAKESAHAKLAALGLTADEIAALTN